MTRNFAALAFVVGAAFLTGCGTVCNLAGGAIHPDTEPRIYGGVLRDVEIIDGVVNKAQEDAVTHASHGDPRAVLIYVPLAVADPVLSFVGDTLTLPITIPLQKRRIASSGGNSESSSGSAAAESENTLSEKPVRIDSAADRPGN